MIRLLRAEIEREIHRAKAYAFDVLADQVLFTLIFLLLSGVIYLLRDDQSSSDAILVALIGFVTWRVADGTILQLVGSVSEDARIGVLEQLHLTVFSLEIAIFARTVSALLYHTIRGFILLIILLLILRQPLPWQPGVLVLFFLTQMTVVGIGYAIIGLHLVTKSVSSITVSVTTVLLFLTGALTPLDNVAWLEMLSRLLPLTLGIKLLRQLLLEDASFTALLQHSDFYWLVLTALIYTAGGWLILRWGQAKSRLEGTLAHY